MVPLLLTALRRTVQLCTLAPELCTLWPCSLGEFPPAPVPLRLCSGSPASFLFSDLAWGPAAPGPLPLQVCPPGIFVSWLPHAGLILISRVSAPGSCLSSERLSGFLALDSSLPRGTGSSRMVSVAPPPRSPHPSLAVRESAPAVPQTPRTERLNNRN